MQSFAASQSAEAWAAMANQQYLDDQNNALDPSFFGNGYSDYYSSVKELDVPDNTDFFMTPKQNTFASPANTSLLFYNAPAGATAAEEPAPMHSGLGIGMARSSGARDEYIMGDANAMFAIMPNQPSFNVSADLSQVSVTPGALAHYSKVLNLHNPPLPSPHMSPTKQPPPSPSKVTKSPVKDRRHKQTGSFSNMEAANLINTDIYLPPSTPSRRVNNASPNAMDPPSSPLASPYHSETYAGISSINASPVRSPPKSLLMPPQGSHRLSFDEYYMSPRPGFSPTLDAFDQTPESASVPQFMGSRGTPNPAGVSVYAMAGSELMMPPLMSPTRAHLSLDGLGYAPSSPQSHATLGARFQFATAHTERITQDTEKEVDSLAWQPIITGPSNAVSEAIIKSQAQQQNNAAHTSSRKSCLPPGKVDSYLQGPDSDGLFACLFPNCGKIFKRRYNARSHIQTHLSDRPYLCEVCDATFVRPHDLRRHEKCHEDEKPYKCVCGKSFTRHDALQRHRSRMICEGGIEIPGKPKKPAAKRGRPRKTLVVNEDVTEDDEEEDHEEGEEESEEDGELARAHADTSPGEASGGSGSDTPSTTQRPPRPPPRTLETAAASHPQHLHFPTSQQPKRADEQFKTDVSGEDYSLYTAAAPLDGSSSKGSQSSAAAVAMAPFLDPALQASYDNLYQPQPQRVVDAGYMEQRWPF